MAHYIVLYSLCLFSALAATTCRSSNFTATFFFGDSLVDTGNNNYVPTQIKADHPPYGRDFPRQAATGRFSNGRMIPDLLATKLGIKQFVQPYLDPRLTPEQLRTGVNFASAGAGYDDMTSVLTGTLPISRQLRMFEEYAVRLKEVAGETESASILGEALVMFSSGSNDFALNFFAPLPSARRLQFSLDGYQDFLLEILEGALKQLYSQGLRKFIVAGVPPFGCMPWNVANRLINPGECFIEQVSAATAYNSKLQGQLPLLQQSLVGSKILYLDFHTNLLNMINNPSKYGFEETRRGCCGSGSFEIGPLCNSLVPVCPNANTYAFFDGVHPTERVYTLITDQIIEHIIPQLQ